MEDDRRRELRSFLQEIPQVDFCCLYGSALHPSNLDKSSMVDFILGVSDPLQWHFENLKLNEDHYASWLVHLGGAELITGTADKIGVGVHFNPFVTWKDKKLKYGVVRMHNLVQDLLNWENFYLSGRLQKPVNVLVDNHRQVRDANPINLRAAVSTALLLLPSKFTEEDLYSKICSLSYMGDLRMLFAEDKNKDCGRPATRSLVCSLPPFVRSKMGKNLGEEKFLGEMGREEAARCMQKVIRRTVMRSSARQAVSGFLAAGGVNATRYLGNKLRKAWKSWA